MANPPKVGDPKRGCNAPRKKVGFNSNREVERPGEILSVLVQIARRLYLKRSFWTLKSGYKRPMR